MAGFRISRTLASESQRNYTPKNWQNERMVFQLCIFMTFAVSFREGKFRNDRIRVQFGLGQNECLVIMGGMYISKMLLPKLWFLCDLPKGRGSRITLTKSTPEVDIFRTSGDLDSIFQPLCLRFVVWPLMLGKSSKHILPIQVGDPSHG